MQEQLSKGLYFSSNQILAFGLHLGQVQPDALVNNGGWYNQNGERIGYGDLTIQDMDRVAAEVVPEETFYVLAQEDCVNPKDSTSPLDSDFVGQEYIANHALFMIEHGKITFFNRSNQCVPMMFDLPASVEVVQV